MASAGAIITLVPPTIVVGGSCMGNPSQGVAISAYFTTRTLAAIVANPVISFLAEDSGFRPMFAMIACLSGTGLAIFWLLGRSSTPEQEA